jgi:hypothetical protein
VVLRSACPGRVVRFFRRPWHEPPQDGPRVRGIDVAEDLGDGRPHFGRHAHQSVLDVGRHTGPERFQSEYRARAGLRVPEFGDPSSDLIRAGRDDRHE